MIMDSPDVKERNAMTRMPRLFKFAISIIGTVIETLEPDSKLMIPFILVSVVVFLAEVIIVISGAYKIHPIIFAVVFLVVVAIIGVWALILMLLIGRREKKDSEND